MGEALGWGALAASSLILGGLLGLARDWSPRFIGLVLAFGAGALISAVSFDLAQEGARIGGPGFLAGGLAVGALTYFGLDRVVERMGARDPGAEAERGTALALGALLDGIPEQTVLGIGIASGEGVGISLLVAIFVSNLPEAIGHRPTCAPPAAARARSAACGRPWRWCARSPRWPATSSRTRPPAISRRRSTASPRARSSSCSSTR